ncbi:MAG: hypothetical protein NTY10_03280 [Candidatus Omnitrophica bacterium]|nr:hypothetical protein [Candidatus Omnitrophota bacterium]
MKVTVHNTSVPGANEIVSLTAGKNGLIYGGYTGNKNHLFFEYNPGRKTTRDLGEKIVSANQLYFKNGEIMTQKIHHALSTLPDGRIVGGTGQNFSCGTCHRKVNEDEGGHVFVYDPESGQAKDLGIPVPHMWIICTTASPDGEVIYGMTYLHNDFFAVSVKTGELIFADQVHGAIWGDSACSHSLICDNDGVVYGSCSDGYIFTYDPKNKKLRESDVKLPGENTCRVDSFALGDDGLIYGGTWETGVLFSLEPKTLKLKELCRPNNGPRLPALLKIGDSIYGAAGGGSQYGTRGAFLFEYNYKNGAYREIGPVVEKETGIEASRIHAMTVGKDGTLYAGETGAQSIFKAESGDIETGNNAYLYIIEL